jgi:hypothetical protein
MIVRGRRTALLPLWTFRMSAKRHGVGLQQYAMLIKIEATSGLMHNDEICSCIRR